MEALSLSLTYDFTNIAGYVICISSVIQNCYDTVDYITYVTHYILWLTYEWNFVSLNPLHLFHLFPSPFPSGNHNFVL